MQRCNVHGCKNEWGKTGISVLCNDLHLLLSARNAECPAFHGLKRIMQRCNTYRHKIQNCLQRCKCRTNEKPLEIWTLEWPRRIAKCWKWLLCMIFTKRKTNAALQQFTKLCDKRQTSTAARCFYKWDKFETKGRTIVPEAGRFYGAGKELLPGASWNISNQIPINFQKCLWCL